jgi:hypothetical protein
VSEIQQLATKLDTEGRKVVSYVAELAQADWHRKVYTEGSVWTIRSIIAHLTSAEEAFLNLLNDVQGGGPGVAEDFLIDDFNEKEQEVLMDLTTAQLLERFRTARGQMIALVGSFSVLDLDKRGRHPYLGTTSLREMIKMVYLHGQVHVREIRQALRAAQA